MSDVVYSNYRVKYLADHQITPNDVQDPVNPKMWVCEDIIPAVSAKAAFQQIINAGGVPVGKARLVRRSVGKISGDYKLKFLMAVLFLVQAGNSVGAAMEQTIESETGWPLRGQLEPALRLLRAGSTFSEAVSVLGMYDETTLAILSAGEHTGTMNQALATALNHLQRRNSAAALMRGAVSMILLDIAMAMSSAMTAVFGLLPQAEKQGVQTKDEVDIEVWQNAIQFGYISNYILLGGAVLAMLVALGMYVGYSFGDLKAREKVETYLRRLPFLGNALEHEAVSTTSGILSHLLKGGVLFAPACEITARTVRLPVVRNYWAGVQHTTMLGTPLGLALSKKPLTVAEQRVVASHTNSQQLAEAFQQISEYRLEQAQKSNKRFIFMGLIVSFLYSGMCIASTLYVNYVQITAIMSASGL